MIEQLHIKNLVLIDSCEVLFEKGLNIITGETGAGKSALMEGVQLLLGQRADSALVRKGEEKGSIKGVFSLAEGSTVLSLLREAGIDHDPSELLIISREISKEGKSKSFINQEAVSINLLQKLSSHLIEIISQHSYHDLKSQEALRDIVDLFGDLQNDVLSYQSLYQKEKEVRSALVEKEAKAFAKDKDLPFFLHQIQEIENANVKEGEEESLFEEYGFLSKSQEIGEKSSALVHRLSDSSPSLIAELSSFKHSCDHLSSYHSTFKESSDLLQEALVALQEVSSLQQNLLSSLDGDPKRLEFLESRLDLFSKLKKKYGPTAADWATHCKALKKQVADYEQIDIELQQLKEELQHLQKQLLASAELLSTKRIKSAEKLQKILTLEIQQLNMQSAEIAIEIKDQDLSASGKDQVSFWLSANKGEKPVSMKDGSSGGELSRILLALKTSLVHKNHTPTIIFDEIDANVGGRTATLIGEKLKELSVHTQVLCITHFPQVAKQGDIHLHVYKEEKEGRTKASIQKLSSHEKEKELLRMLGGKNITV